MPIPIVLITFEALSIGANVAIGAGGLTNLYFAFRDQANQAYNASYPDRANDTPSEQANDMNRDAFRHSYASARMAQVLGDDPLPLDLDGDGKIELTSLENGVYFDFLGTDYARKMGPRREARNAVQRVQQTLKRKAVNDNTQRFTQTKIHAIR